jgi:hypothetical protein
MPSVLYVVRLKTVCVYMNKMFLMCCYMRRSMLAGRAMLGQVHRLTWQQRRLFLEYILIT